MAESALAIGAVCLGVCSATGKSQCEAGSQDRGFNVFHLFFLSQNEVP